MCVRKKRGESQSVKVSCDCFRVAIGFVFLVFHSFFSFPQPLSSKTTLLSPFFLFLPLSPLNHSLTHPSFHPHCRRHGVYRRRRVCDIGAILKKIERVQPSGNNGLDDIAHAKEVIQCDMDASSASINWHNTTSFLCVATYSNNLTSYVSVIHHKRTGNTEEEENEKKRGNKNIKACC